MNGVWVGGMVGVGGWVDDWEGGMGRLDLLGLGFDRG